MSHWSWRRIAFPNNPVIREIKVTEKRFEESHTWAYNYLFGEDMRGSEMRHWHDIAYNKLRHLYNLEVYGWSLQERLLIYFYGPVANVSDGNAIVTPLEVTFEVGKTPFEATLGTPHIYNIDTRRWIVIYDSRFVEYCAQQTGVKSEREKEHIDHVFSPYDCRCISCDEKRIS